MAEIPAAPARALIDPPGTTRALKLSHSIDGACHTIVLDGELDMASAQDVLAQARLLTYDATTVVLDLGGLRFMDSSGLRLILRLRQLCRRNGCRLRLRSARGQVLELFETTGLLAPMRERGLLVG